MAASQPTSALLENKPIRSLAYAERVLREWSNYFDVCVRLNNWDWPSGLSHRAHRAYLYIQRHEQKQQTMREEW